MICITTLSVNLDNEIYLSKKTQIAYLIIDEAFSKIFSEYADFAAIFSSKLAAKLFKYTNINNYAMKLIGN